MRFGGSPNYEVTSLSPLPHRAFAAPIGVRAGWLEIPNAQIATTDRSAGNTRVTVSPKRSKADSLGRDNGRYVISDQRECLLDRRRDGCWQVSVAIISTFLSTRSPDDLKLLMIDPRWSS